MSSRTPGGTRTSGWIPLDYSTYTWKTWMFHMKVCLHSLILLLVSTTFSSSLAAPSRDTAHPFPHWSPNAPYSHVFGATTTCFIAICHNNVTLSGGKGLVFRSLLYLLQTPYSSPSSCFINFTSCLLPWTTLTRSLPIPLVGAMWLLRFDSFPNKLAHW